MMCRSPWRRDRSALAAGGFSVGLTTAEGTHTNDSPACSLIPLLPSSPEPRGEESRGGRRLAGEEQPRQEQEESCSAPDSGSLPAEHRESMPFHDNVYYPLVPEPCGSSCASFPSLLTTSQLPNSGAQHPKSFRFRPRHECVDWRKIGTIDVDRVAGELDFLTLQENITRITFCNVDCERCPHCHSPLDPVLLKLFKLAQLTIEYLLHSQEYLTSNLQSLEDKVQATLVDSERIKAEVAKQTEEVRALKDECKRRKKIIATQQMMIHAGTNTYHKCPHCDKAFMNYSFLQSHIQRRHSEEANVEKQKKKQCDHLQSEINKLKEELQLSKWQLDTEQSAKEARLSKELENQKTKEEDILRRFEKWKDEEKDKLKDEMNKVKDMFMGEFKELTAKNTALEKQLQELNISNMQLKESVHQKESHRHDQEEARSKSQDMQNVTELLDKQEHKWNARIELIHQEHEKERNQLLSQVEQLRLSVTEEQQANNIRYKRKIDELAQKIKEQNELIDFHKEQIKDLSMKALENKPSSSVTVPTLKAVETKPSPAVKHVTISTLKPVELKPSAAVRHELPVSTRMLEPIEELSDEDQDTIEETLGTSKQHLISALKNNPSLTKELRYVLEQGLTEKLESLGIKSGARGIPNDHLNRVLTSIELNREEKGKQVPSIQKIREKLEHQLSLRMEESSLSNKLAWSSCPFDSEGKQSMAQQRSSSLVLPNQSKFKPTVKLPPPDTQQRTAFTTSTPKKKTFPRRCPPAITPPFSSDDEDDVEKETDLQSCEVLENVQPKPSSSRKLYLQRVTDQSDSDSFGSELEEVDPKMLHHQVIQKKTPVKPEKATVVQELSKKNQKQLYTCGTEKKPVGGIDITHAFLKKEEVKELKCTEFDEDDFNFSPSEEDVESCEANVGKKNNEVNMNQKASAWASCKMIKGEKQDMETSNTVVSTMSEWSDYSES